jgi:hypothetical protein
MGDAFPSTKMEVLEGSGEQPIAAPLRLVELPAWVLVVAVIDEAAKF